MSESGRIVSCKMVYVAAAILFRAHLSGEAAEPGVPILRMAKQWKDPAAKECGGTIWRYHETWQTDVVRDDAGALVRVEPGVWRKKAPGGNDRTGPFELLPAKKVVGSEFPAQGWEQPDFDDGDWKRNPAPFDSYYRSIAMIAIRGKFQVPDSAATPEMELTVSFQGGAVAYLNGREIGREGLPAGKIANDLLANDYLKETDDGGSSKTGFGLIAQGTGTGEVLHKGEADKLSGMSASDKAVVAEHYRQRFRTIQVKVPTTALRKGVNVLAIEVHRAPAHPAMFLALPGNELYRLYSLGWNRCLVDDIQLTAKSASGIVPNIARPVGVQVWNASTLTILHPQYYGDPNESVHPVRLTGARNGTYSGQLVVSSPSVIKGVSATVTDLKARDGQTIPASAITVGYQLWDVSTFGPDFCGGSSGSKYGMFNTLDAEAGRSLRCLCRSGWRVPGRFPIRCSSRRSSAWWNRRTPWRSSTT